MTDTRITAPVTDDLLKELISSEDLLAELDGPNVRIKDTEHYRPAVLQLEALAKAVLAARASVSSVRKTCELAPASTPTPTRTSSGRWTPSPSTCPRMR